MSCYRPSLRRSPIKAKPRVKKERSPWLPQRVREDAKGMLRLRQEAFNRSEGRCECWMTKPGATAADWCGENVTWMDGDLHHVQSRAHGGSDVIENVAFIHHDCHEKVHGKPEWGKRA